MYADTAVEYCYTMSKLFSPTLITAVFHSPSRTRGNESQVAWSQIFAEKMEMVAKTIIRDMVPL